MDHNLRLMGSHHLVRSLGKQLKPSPKVSFFKWASGNVPEADFLYIDP